MTAIAASALANSAKNTAPIGTSGNPGIANNFQAFLQLLTTQLRNQNPLDPLDTNQFTQQLVQFAQVEQQLKSNDQLGTLVSLQQTAQSTAALDYVGKSVAVDGTTAPLSNGKATWSLSTSKPVTASINVTSSSGQTVYSTTMALNAGNNQNFTWNGQDASGNQWPDGPYAISVNAVDATGQPAAVATEINGTVDSADMTQNPPMLSV